jgi:hypothetical protein
VGSHAVNFSKQNSHFYVYFVPSSTSCAFFFHTAPGMKNDMKKKMSAPPGAA